MKIAVYSCVTGGYDVARPPLAIEDECDYFMISDDPQNALGEMKWIDIDQVVPDINMNPKDKNRYCKMHPQEIFRGYDFSFYYDGSIQIVKPIAHNIEKVGRTGLAMHKHRRENCIYSEGIFLTWLGAADKKEMVEDMRRYVQAGVPRNFGLFECGVIVTDLRNETALKLYDNWYSEYMRGAKRDQQAFVYVLWTMGLQSEDVGNLGDGYNVFTNPEIDWNRGAHYR